MPNNPGRWLAAAVLLGIVACSSSPAYKDSSQSIDDRVADLLGRMTLEEKFWQLFMVVDDLKGGLDKYQHGAFGLQLRPGADSTTGPGETALRSNAVQRYFIEHTRLGIPIIPFEEALHGLVQDGATAFPQAIGLAATWDTVLMRRVASAIAEETRTRGIRQVLSPVLNIASDVRWGRVEETYGEDPWLVTQMGLAFIEPLEAAGVVTTPKHFIANVGDGGRDSYPIDWSRRLLGEVYLPPFQAAIQRSHARSVMAAYNSVDGSPATANSWLLTTKLRNEWDFRGVVIADAGATGGANVLHFTSPDYATSARLALEAGLDVMFQTSADHAKLFWPAFQNGAIDSKVIDRAVSRVLRLKFELGLFDHPYVDVDSAVSSNGTAEHRALALDAAREAITLLKDEDGALPLARTLRRVAVIGTDAVEARLGGYSGPGNNRVTIMDGIRKKLPAAVVTYAAGPGRGDRELVPVPAANLSGLRGEYWDNVTMTGEPRLTRNDPAIDFGWTLLAPDSTLPFDWFSVRWTGGLVAPASGPVQLGVEGNDGYRLYLDGVLLIDNWRKQSYRTLTSEVRLERGRSYDIKLEYYENTGGARVKLVWNYGVAKDGPHAIAGAVATARSSDVAIVVLGIEEGEFRDRASLRLPGHQEELIRAVVATGKPVVIVLVGGSAITMGDWIDQVPAVLLAWYPGEMGGDAVADVLFGDYNPAGRLPVTFPLSEGQLPLTYYHKPTGRGDDYADLTGRPAFPFGSGLSYTTFEYRDLDIAPNEIASRESVTVRFKVKNTGTRGGDEVAQLYLRDELASVAQPLMKLAGFRRIHLEPGEETSVSLHVPLIQLSMLDRDLRRVIEPGRFRVMVGGSVVDIRLRGMLTVR
ncbi:MAG TPA: glycoside hydrolase family 3 N-terminal domain-containing protein [Gemmatimonadales bacterium]|nr:glycoside hydrolase family 3 N-terminal domain-containing protein [Gemmatimonadales bacterium]